MPNAENNSWETGPVSEHWVCRWLAPEERAGGVANLQEPARSWGLETTHQRVVGSGGLVEWAAVRFGQGVT